MQFQVLPECVGCAQKELDRLNTLAADQRLQDAIDAAALTLHTVQEPAQRRAAWLELQRLSKLRTAQQVEQMELDRGLC